VSVARRAAKASPLGLVASCLQRATSRAKSDVANKLVSMLLHELSAKVIGESGRSVSSPAYARLVAEHFGDACPFCGQGLAGRRVAVEHLDGMNRFRVGLHVPGNVLVACHTCNTEKRRDDQLERLHLADSGWGSFLSHDGTRCIATCKSCSYWRRVWPDAAHAQRLVASRAAIEKFRRIEDHAELLTRAERIREECAVDIQRLYRDGQRFASDRISDDVKVIIARLAPPAPTR
jgi:hypothetical protein